MRRVFRISRKRRIHGSFLLAGWFAFLGGGSQKGTSVFPESIFFFTLLVALLLGILTTIFIPRVVFTESTVTVYRWNNRKKLDTAIAQLTGYVPLTPDRWALVSNSVAYALPAVDYPELHAYILAEMPQLVAKRRWKCGQIPPTEDFVNVWAFGGDPGGSELIGLAAAAALGTLILRSPPYPILGFAVGNLPRCLENFFSFITFDGAGVTHKSCLQTTTIRWEDVSALVCEGQKPGERRFIVISGQRSIVIPTKIAQNLEPMRKFFYSIPEGTTCVNFGENFNRGYRTRKRKGKTARAAIPGLVDE